MIISSGHARQPILSKPSTPEFNNAVTAYGEGLSRHWAFMKMSPHGVSEKSDRGQAKSSGRVRDVENKETR